MANEESPLSSRSTQLRDSNFFFIHIRSGPNFLHQNICASRLVRCAVRPTSKRPLKKRCFFEISLPRVPPPEANEKKKFEKKKKIEVR